MFADVENVFCYVFVGAPPGPDPRWAPGGPRGEPRGGPDPRRAPGGPRGEPRGEPRGGPDRRRAPGGHQGRAQSQKAPREPRGGPNPRRAPGGLRGGPRGGPRAQWRAHGRAHQGPGPDARAKRL